jgi:hypothetical protein
MNERNRQDAVYERARATHNKTMAAFDDLDKTYSMYTITDDELRNIAKTESAKYNTSSTTQNINSTPQRTQAYTQTVTRTAQPQQLVNHKHAVAKKGSSICTIF